MNQDPKFRYSQQTPLGRSVVGSMFAIHGDLDGDQVKKGEFIEREQFIGLLVGKEEFFLPIAAVREIIMLVPITYVPNAPQFIDGIMNLRGNILPAVNLRKMMGLPRGDVTASARVIVVRNEESTYALLVDGITYVIALTPSEIEQQTLPGKGPGAELIGSLANHGSKVTGIIDVTRILRALSTSAHAEHSTGISSKIA